MTARARVGRTAGRRFLTAGILGIAFGVLIVLSASATAAFWSRPSNVVALVVILVGSTILMLTGFLSPPDGSHARDLAFGTAGVITGLLVNPSTGALVGLALSTLVLSDLVRSFRWSLLAIFGAGIAAGVVLQAALAR